MRYFSSRLFTDPLLDLFLPSEWSNKGIKCLYTEHSIHVSLGFFEGFKPPVRDLLIFKKKLESENYLYLHLCSLLTHQSCQFLSPTLQADEDRIKKFLCKNYGLPPPPEPDVQSISSISSISIHSGQKSTLGSK